MIDNDELDDRPCRWLAECSELGRERHCTKLNEMDCPYADEFYGGSGEDCVAGIGLAENEDFTAESPLRLRATSPRGRGKFERTPPGGYAESGGRWEKLCIRGK